MADSTPGVNTEQPRGLALSTCIGWGVGSIGMAALLGVTNSLILKYAVDNLGLAAVVAGLLIALTRVADAVVDPAIGMLSDRTVSRWGRRLPYLLAGAIACAISPVVLFALPLAVPEGFTIAAVVFGLFFFAAAHTTFNVPYMAMPVEMTADYHARTTLFSFRIYGIALGGLAGGALAPHLVAEFGGDSVAFARMSVVMGLLILVACLACFWFTRRAPVLQTAETGHRPRLADLRHVLRNRPFIRLLTAKVFIVSGTGVGASALAFFVTGIMGATLSLLGLLATLSTLGLAVSQPLWLRVSRRLGKRACFMVAAVSYVVVVSSWLLSGAEEARWLFGTRALLLGMSGGGILLASQAMLPDCLDHEYRQSGIRHEGALTGLYTTVERGASALGVALAGWILGLGGYVGGQGVVSGSAVTAIYLCVAIVPALFIAVSMAVLWRYDLEE